MSDALLADASKRRAKCALMGIIMVAIAPHFVNVQHGLRQVNDWNVHNCLGPKP